MTDQNSELYFGAIDSLLFSYHPNNYIDMVYEYGDQDISYKGAQASYGYSNGNVTTDPVRGIGEIKYNILNLPYEVNFTNGSQIKIIYDGDGNIWRKTLTSTLDTLPNGEYEMVIDYIDGFEYHDGAFASYMHPQGRVAPGDNGFNCEYFLRDHLGSVRVVYADVDGDRAIDFDTVECELLEEHHYYPFGMEMEGMWTDFRTGQFVNRNTYNGKQAQTEMGWDWINYGARYYDGMVGRFTGVDPKGDKFAELSLYNYASNNPITNIDLWGLQGEKPSILLDQDVKDLTSGKISIDQYIERQEAKGKGALIAVTFLLPGPEDVAIAGFAATKFGGAFAKGIGKASEEAISFLRGLFKNADQGKKVDEIFSGASKGRTTKGKTEQFEKTDGSFKSANNDFDKMELSDVKEIITDYGPGRTGRLDDGTSVTVRPGSTDGRPTLELRNTDTGRGKEIRYGKKQ